LAEHVPKQAGLVVLAITLAACLFAGWSGLVAVLVALVVFAGLRRVMMKRLGGTTGDTAGALLELLELAILIVLALYP
jgi:adenosylcobinamide-GDP ribazoletransferase